MIRLEGLRVAAGAFSTAPVDLDIRRGDYLVLLGPSGAGKSLLLQAIAGLREPDAGHVMLHGRRVTGVPPELRRLGYVPQDGLLFPHLDVAANIGFAVPRGRRRRVVAEAASLVGAAGLLGRGVADLSGGERQRVALARALAADPVALLVDEPLSALDGPARLELQGVLRDVQSSLGLTVVHVTHDLAEARELGTRWAVLIGGRLRQVGAPAEILAAPTGPDVAAFIGA
jgi:ABC-type Fe3+/spermidine/putrescine transport system ATPase subunit